MTTEISIIIPLLNEAESLPHLAAWIERVMAQLEKSYEVIFIDDGSTDESWPVIEGLIEKNQRFRAIRFRRNYGKSAALNEGFIAARGQVVITMDADMQDSPDEIPALYKMITEAKFDLVSGWKKKRYDPISKTLPSRFFNGVTRCVSGIKNLHDFNCGLKAYRVEVVKSIQIYGEMHRYIPVIANWAGFNKIGEKVVEHHARKYGKSKFGMSRFIHGFLDLLTITFVTRFGKKPMHLFGSLGTIMFILGFLGAAYLGVAKLYSVYNNIPARLLTDRPSFYLLLTCMIIGSLLFIAGFLGELIAASSPERNSYQIRERIG
ncbi:MAG: glycosyltransferase family 2 protein [Bacteroidia bacterium]|nr:glycosyltransferase family 2 protein [Bacteroidia bacterium]